MVHRGEDNTHAQFSGTGAPPFCSAKACLTASLDSVQPRGGPGLWLQWGPRKREVSSPAFVQSSPSGPVSEVCLPARGVLGQVSATTDLCPGACAACRSNPTRQNRTLLYLRGVTPRPDVDRGDRLDSLKESQTSWTLRQMC